MRYSYTCDAEYEMAMNRFMPYESPAPVVVLDPIPSMSDEYDRCRGTRHCHCLDCD